MLLHKLRLEEINVSFIWISGQSGIQGTVDANLATIEAATMPVDTISVKENVKLSGSASRHP